MTSIIERARALDQKIGESIQQNRQDNRRPGEVIAPQKTLTNIIGHALRLRPPKTNIANLFKEGERVHFGEMDERIANRLRVLYSPKQPFFGNSIKTLEEVGLYLDWTEEDRLAQQKGLWDGRYTVSRKTPQARNKEDRKRANPLNEARIRQPE